MKRTFISIIITLTFASSSQEVFPVAKTDTLFIELADISIHSVLTQPQNTEYPPVALIIGGSGPTDLNGNQPLMQNNSLKFLSEEMANHDIATLRFDKRGVGKSSSEKLDETGLTIDQYAKDVKSIINFLKNTGFEEIYIIGHSEGSLIALLALQETEVKGFISIAGAGNSADSILKKQLKPQLPPGFYHSVETIIDSLKKEKYVKNIPPQLNSLFRSSVQPYLISWFKYSPAELIKNIQCPSLIIQGDKDIQIDMEEAILLAKATEKANLVKIKNMNHILKTIHGDLQENIQSYTNPQRSINEELIKTLTNFINN
ncbi:MAG: alpha/beta fold hydrolase [Bacteroidales bacterium]|jgi:pimeloyl-ACP methyl ester carboxylesterase|nr:alpha/beta fold hydrolase [Bacteroidales bacterium]